MGSSCLPASHLLARVMPHQHISCTTSTAHQLHCKPMLPCGFLLYIPYYHLQTKWTFLAARCLALDDTVMQLTSSQMGPSSLGASDVGLPNLSLSALPRAPASLRRQDSFDSYDGFGESGRAGLVSGGHRACARYCILHTVTCAVQPQYAADCKQQYTLRTADNMMHMVVRCSDVPPDVPSQGLHSQSVFAHLHTNPRS